MNSPDLDHQHSRWRMTRRRLVTLAIVILAAGWFGRFAYLRIALRPTPRPQYWEAKLAELDPPPPGAISPEEASKILTSRPFDNDPAVTALTNFEVSDVLSGDWDTNRSDIAAAIKAFESKAFLDARAELQRALHIGWRDRISLDLNHVTFPSYVDYRAWAKWLVARSRWSRVRSDVNTTVEDWLTTFQICRQVRRQQTLIAHLVEIAIVALVAREIAIACQENLEPFDVVRFAEQVDEILGKPANAGDILRGEDIYVQNMLESFFVREGGNWMDVGELVATWHNTAGFTRTTQIYPSRIWNLASPLFHDLETARQRVHQLYAMYDSCKNIADCRELERRAQTNPEPVRSAVLDGVIGNAWTFVRVPSLYYRSRCDLEAALASLAIHEYRRKHGQFPETLSELVPEFLLRIPIDYADGQPMRYRRTSEGYLLYSIGEDGRDDEGRCNDKYPADFNRGPDVVFSKMKRSELGKQ